MCLQFHLSFSVNTVFPSERAQRSEQSNHNGRRQCKMNYSEVVLPSPRRDGAEGSSRCSVHTKKVISSCSLQSRMPGHIHEDL